MRVLQAELEGRHSQAGAWERDISNLEKQQAAKKEALVFSKGGF